MNNNKVQVIKKQEVLGKEFKVYGSIEEPLFLAKDVAEWLEYDASNVSKMVKNVDEDERIIARINNTSAIFLTEDGLYETLFMSRKPIAKEFKKEVKVILKQLRTTGVVITETATEEAIDFEKKFGVYRIRKTFTNSDNLIANYTEFKELSKAKKLNGQERIKLSNIIFDSVNTRLNTTKMDLKPSELMQMQELLTDIKSDTLKISNRTNGGIKASKTKLINQCQNYIEKQEEYISSIEPSPEDYVCINYHGFTENCIYGSTDLDGNLRFSTAYNIWRSKFPKHEVQIDTTINFSKQVHLYMYFDIMDKFDVTNMQKSFIDMLCLCYGVDDYYISIGKCDRNDYVDSYEEGKIYYCLKQGE